MIWQWRSVQQYPTEDRTIDFNIWICTWSTGRHSDNDEQNNLWFIKIEWNVPKCLSYVPTTVKAYQPWYLYIYIRCHAFDHLAQSTENLSYYFLPMQEQVSKQEFININTYIRVIHKPLEPNRKEERTIGNANKFWTIQPIIFIQLGKNILTMKKIWERRNFPWFSQWVCLKSAVHNAIYIY